MGEMNPMKAAVQGNNALLPQRGYETISSKISRPAGWLKFEQGWLTPYQTLQNLETATSLLQQLSQGLTGISESMNEAIVVLHSAWNRNDRPGRPPQEVDQGLSQHLAKIDELVRETRFHGRGLLDGQSGVVGIGKGVDFIRGGPNTATSPPEGYEVRITALPTRASLSGGVPIHENWLREEAEIFLAEGDRFVRFVPNGETTISEFLEDFQRAITLAGLDLEVGLTRQRRLVVRHSQYGSHFKFKGCSRVTPLLANRPGRVEWSHKGKDIQGTLGGEAAFGVGRMLVGFLDNANTSELAVVWRGEPLPAGNIARCHVIQNGLELQVGNGAERNRKKISLPSFYQKAMGGWLETNSGFRSLSELRARTWQEAFDAMQVLFAVSCEVDEWRDKTSNWIKQYQNLALEILRNEAVVTPDEGELETSGNQNAAQMAAVMRTVLDRKPVLV